MRLLFVPVLGPIKVVDVSENALLDKAYELLDCYCVENVYICGNRYIMLVDESGKLCDPPKRINLRVSPLYGGYPDDLIVGSALIGKFGFTENGPDLVGLNEYDIALFKNHFGPLSFEGNEVC